MILSCFYAFKYSNLRISININPLPLSSILQELTLMQNRNYPIQINIGKKFVRYLNLLMWCKVLRLNLIQYLTLLFKKSLDHLNEHLNVNYLNYLLTTCTPSKEARTKTLITKFDIDLHLRRKFVARVSMTTLEIKFEL